MAYEWTCPYCDKAQIVTDNSSTGSERFWHGKSAPVAYGYRLFSILCANLDCKRIYVTASIGEAIINTSGGFKSLDDNKIIFSQQLLPQGLSKPQPDFIPKALREDYHEACLIRDLSPKASATLTRRCLQGMIRDFAGISKNRLFDEIDALRQAVEDGSADRSIAPESVEAIDHVRSVGNIGAHMEKDIDLIIPVDPGEAQALIELVEMLFEEWYVARNTRAQRLAKIGEIAGQKHAIKSVPANTIPPYPSGEGQ